MTWDLHAHLAGTGAGRTGNLLSPVFRRSFACRQILRRLGLPPAALDAPDSDERIARFVLEQIEASRVNHVVLLALDAAHRSDGTLDETNTRLVTDNDFVAEVASRSAKTHFGASVHPYRRDALPELERLIAKGACLVKWLPSAQNIQPDHPRCFPFYDLLAQNGVPLLCHTGPEHTLDAFPNSLNDPRRLVPALERGVTVIAAHCGANLYLHERSHFRTWCELALRHERLFGDLSAFGVITRIQRLRSLRRRPALLEKCVFGSDFPASALPLSCLGAIGVRAALRLRRTGNRFDQSDELLRCAGVPRSVFERGGQLLRLAPTTSSPLASGRSTSP